MRRSDRGVAVRPALALLAVVSSLAAAAGQPPPAECGVLVYGATPAGIAAALAAADDGQTVILAEPTKQIGGMVTSGLSHTDYHAFEGLTGAYLDFARRVEAHYAAGYGKDSPQVKDCYRGTFGEPKVNRKVFEAMLAERKQLTVVTQSTLDAVAVAKEGEFTRVTEVRFTGRKAWGVKPAVVIDATYEGDLMAKAGVPWTVGREGKDKYGESLAPAKADGQLQAYNFRFVMTKEPKNRVAVTPPEGYRRDDFLPVLELFKSGDVEKAFGYPPTKCVFKAQTPPLPNGKYDINDVSRSAVRLSLPGKNLGWPDGDAAARAKIFADHLRDQVGLLYFLQTDEAVPEKVRTEAGEWGWCKDEFTDTAHLPPQLYVREARRMVGDTVFTQADCDRPKDTARSRHQPAAIAVGEYGNNCHGTAHDGPRFGGKHTGEFYHPVPPYQIPYGVLVPPKLANLLVPGAVSSSHVGFCALRLEPIWMSLGQAAGHAAHLAIDGKVPVQKVPVQKLQRRLHKDRSATVYVGDVPPGHPDFAAVQWWGTAGGFHGLEPPPATARGKNITGQYYESYPAHDAKLDAVLDAATAMRWAEVARGLKLTDPPAADGTLTRGAWLRSAYQQAK